MIRKLITAQIILLLGLGSIYFLPRGYDIRESAIIMVLPNKVNEWFGETMETSEVVINALADDTNYSQSQYKRRTPNTEDKIEIKESTPEEKIVELEDKITRTLAEELNKLFLEVIIANGFDYKAIKILKAKKNLRLIDGTNYTSEVFLKFVSFNQDIMIQSEAVSYTHLTLPTSDLV